ncbi:MAG: hypothetical protein ACE5D6_09265, partial [Candidatus Zixiibacteriota bacterium]
MILNNSVLLLFPLLIVSFHNAVAAPFSTIVIDLNINDATAVHAETFLVLPAFNPDWDSDDSSLCIETSHALHPSIVYKADSLWGYQYWMAYTPFCISESDENPHLAVSNDGLNWQEFISESDTLQNPIIDYHYFNATHLSDPDLFYCVDEILYLIYRVSWEIAGKDIHSIYLSQTSNGINWSNPIVILSDSLLEQDNISSFTSPSIEINNDSTYTIFIVEPRANGTTYLDSSRVIRYNSSKIDSGWAFGDTCYFPSSNDSMKIWHQEILRLDEYKLIAFVTEAPNAGLNFGDSSELFLSISYDNGGSWNTNPEPILSWFPDTSS